MKTRRSNKGFSMIEITVTLAVVSALAAVAVPNYSKQRCRAKVAESKVVLKSVYNAQMHMQVSTDAFAKKMTQLDLDLP